MMDGGMGSVVGLQLACKLQMGTLDADLVGS